MGRGVGKCPICGAALTGDYKYTGRGAAHQTTKIPDITLTEEAKRARTKGLSYGKYMILKEEAAKR